MILIGYISIFSYIFFLIFIVGGILRKKYNVEISRKIIHIGLFFVWILIDIFIKNTIHQIIIPIIFIIVNYLSYKYKIFKNMEREEENEPGTVYFSIAITIIMLISYINSKFYYASGIATFSLTFGDGFAAIIGKFTKSKQIKNNKTLNGFISCFIFSFLSIYIFNNIYNLDLTILMCIAISGSVAIFELVDKGLDNFSVVFISFLLSFIFLNYNLEIFLDSILLSEILFTIIFLAKGLDYYGSLLAIVMCISYMCFGGTFGITLLLSEYFFIFFVSKLKKIIKNKKTKEKPRNFLQVLINGGLGTLFIILYGIFNKNKLLILSIITLSGCFIDSISSDIGVLSKKEPYDFIKRKRIEKGVSGGISYLGTISALISSFLIALITTKTINLSNYYIILITGLIFFQTIIDSIFGSLFQVKYICTKCNKITENKEHCNKITNYFEGVSWINNNVVNIMSSIITAIISIIIL